MPATRIIETEETTSASSDVAASIAEAIEKHASTRQLRAQRARGYRGVYPPLAQTVALDLGPDEQWSDLARAGAADIVAIIEADADGEAWKGEVALLGEPHANGKPNVLARVVVKLDGETTTKPTRETEYVGTLTALKATIEGLGNACVRIANARGSEVEANAKMVMGVAEWASKLGGNQDKWAYKMHRETEKTERAREEAQERAAKTRARWSAIETFAEEWKDIADTLAKYYTKGRKPGDPKRPPPKRPTQQECEAVFAEMPSLDTIRATVAEMLAEPDVARRCTLAKRLAAETSALPKDVQLALKTRMVQTLGPERALEVAAWLSLPLN